MPLELPLGEEEKFHGVADVLTDQGFEYEPDGQHHAEPIPADVADEEHRLHDELVEEIVAGDDEQLERYLSGEVPSDRPSWSARSPTRCSNASSSRCSSDRRRPAIGVDRLADFICELGPSPADRPATVTAGTGSAAMEVDVVADPAGKPLGYVFKTVADQFVGQVSLFKVLSGTVAVDDRLVNTASGTEERLHGAVPHARQGAPARQQGRRRRPRRGRQADRHAHRARRWRRRTRRCASRPRPPPAPSFGLALKPITQSDDDKLSGALQRLIAEDPALVVERNEETGQTVLRGAGDTHLAVALERLARKFGVNVETEDVRVPYRETITGSAEAEGKVKKQSGGHGQFAVANLRVSPKARGEGAEFVNSIVGGAIPKQYIPAVQRGVEEAMATGGVHGFPVVDVRVECYDGKYHSVDSSDMAFRTAAAHGLKEALQKAGAAVLEPVSLLTVIVPAGYQGDVLGDLNARRGRVNGTSVLGNGTPRDRRPRAGRRDPALRRRAALDDRRSGHVRRHPRPLRAAALPPHRQDQDSRSPATATVTTDPAILTTSGAAVDAPRSPNESRASAYR